MRTLNKILVVADEHSFPSPAQQVLDRLLAGFARDGVWTGRAAPVVQWISRGGPPAWLARRQREQALEIGEDPSATARNADLALVFGPGLGELAPGAATETVLGNLPAGAACLVIGRGARDAGEARARQALAQQRGVRFATFGDLAVTYRLPDVRWKSGSAIRHALVVVQGEDPVALPDGVSALVPDLAHGGVDFGAVKGVETLAGDAVWAAGDQGRWSWDLLSSALSRSSNPQGNSLKDGRTQDLVGLGEVRKLARQPRAWITEFADGARATLLALDGVVTDVNLALENRRGVRMSTRLYRPPAPRQDAFDHVVAVALEFFAGGRLPWGEDRSVAAATWLAALEAATHR